MAKYALLKNGEFQNVVNAAAALGLYGTTAPEIAAEINIYVKSVTAALITGTVTMTGFDSSGSSPWGGFIPV